MQEYLTRKEQIGIELDGLLPPNMKDIKEKIEGYQFNDFQYWEINNVHDMRLVSAIADNRILSKNFTKQIFIEYANEYDDVIRTMKEKSEEGPEGMVLVLWLYLHLHGSMLLIFTITLQLKWIGQGKTY